MSLALTLTVGAALDDAVAGTDLEVRLLDTGRRNVVFAGFMSHMSMCDGPPCIHSRMHFLAFAGAAGSFARA